MVQAITIQKVGNDGAVPMHCLYCGQQVYTGSEAQLMPCPHLAFAYLALNGSWHVPSATFAEHIADLDLSRQTPATLKKHMHQQGLDDRWLVIEIIYGEADDPIQFRDCFGFALP